MTNSVIHGTPSAYSNGCRCADCAAAGKEFRDRGTYDAYMAGATKVKPLFYPTNRTEAFDPEDPRHGTISAYTRGCRCSWCKLAGIEYRGYKKLGLRLPADWNSHD